MENYKPSEALAKQAAETHFLEPVKKVDRFPTGLVHYVYDVRMAKNQIVVRMSTPENRHQLANGLYWLERLRPLGVPLPKVVFANLDVNVPYVLLERLNGSDLGNIYGDLTPSQKKDIAGIISNVQGLVAQLPQGSGFGFVSSYEKGFPHTSWAAVVDHHLRRSRIRIDSIGAVNSSYVDDIERISPKFQNYFDSIGPTPFLDDITTKNVIIDNGRFTGIVDVDQVCFGDPIFTIALTQMGLMSGGADLDYIEYWCDEINATEAQRSVLQFYAGLFCLDFMSEVGQAFNKDSTDIDWKWLSCLKSCHAQIMHHLR
ncbi:MAG: phosphotransferase [Pseudomonadota bacterium]